nr:DUF4375 domain-containing protein [Micromonospora sp. DSM 115978]
MINEATTPRIVVSAEALADDDESTVMSFVSIVDELLERGIADDGLADGTLAAYYTDVYAAQVANGGFAQFLINGGHRPDVLAAVRDCLENLGATAHAALFDRFLACWTALTESTRQEFLASQLFGENPTRDKLNEPLDDFFALNASDPIIDRLAGWLRGHPDLLVLPRGRLSRYVAARVAACES